MLHPRDDNGLDEVRDRKPSELPVHHPFRNAHSPVAYTAHPRFSHPIVNYGAEEENNTEDVVIDPASVGIDLLAYSAFGVVTGLVFAKFLNVGRARAVKVGVGVGLGKMVWDYGIDAVKHAATPTLKL